MIVVYSIYSLNSFRDVSSYIEYIEKHYAPNILKILCANKCDRECERRVLKEDMEDCMTEFHFDKCYETSAIEGYEHTIS